MVGTHYPGYAQIAANKINNSIANGQTQRTHTHTASTQKEIDHHAKLSANWWNLNGPMQSLHKLNELR